MSSKVEPRRWLQRPILWTAMSYPLPMDLVSGGHPCCESSASCKNQCSVIKWIIKETSHLAHAYPRLVNPAWVRPFPLWMHIFTHTRLYPYPVPSSILTLLYLPLLLSCRARKEIFILQWDLPEPDTSLGLPTVMLHFLAPALSCYFPQPKPHISLL